MDATEGAALTLEHLAFGRSRVGGSHSLPHFGARIPSSVSRHAPDNAYHLNRSQSILQARAGQGISPGVIDGSTLRKVALGSGRPELPTEERNKHIDQLLDLLGPTDIFDLFYRKTDVVMRALTKVLPPRETGEILVKAVSALCAVCRESCSRLDSISRRSIGCIAVSRRAASGEMSSADNVQASMCRHS